MVLTSPWWRFLEKYVYATPELLACTRSEPMQVLCVGPPRSATESLQAALLELELNHTHHGWDILFEEPSQALEWVKLARRKWLGEAPGLPLTAEDFDKILGNCVAVTDAAASCFAAEMIAAYPEAKVILNTRNDLDAWMESLDESVLGINRSWSLYLLHWFDRQLWVGYHVYERFLWPGLFRCLDSRQGFSAATRATGRWVYEEHCDMIRGLVRKDRLLEWSVQDGWEPLCKFLDKKVPVTPFPHVNTREKGWKEKEDKLNGQMGSRALRNIGVMLAVLFGITAAAMFTNSGN